MMKTLLTVLLGLAVMVAVVGCESGDSDESHSITFVNNSSYNVNIAPNGQDTWLAFLLSPGQNRTISLDTPVYYVYSPSALVQQTQNGDVVTFTDIPKSSTN
jgi:hypothetical protein